MLTVFVLFDIYTNTYVSELDLYLGYVLLCLKFIIQSLHTAHITKSNHKQKSIKHGHFTKRGPITFQKRVARGKCLNCPTLNTPLVGSEKIYSMKNEPLIRKPKYRNYLRKRFQKKIEMLL